MNYSNDNDPIPMPMKWREIALIVGCVSLAVFTLFRGASSAVDMLMNQPWDSLTKLYVGMGTMFFFFIGTGLIIIRRIS